MPDEPELVAHETSAKRERPTLEAGLKLREDRLLGNGLFDPCLSIPHELLPPLPHLFEVSEGELEINRLDVIHRLNLAFHVMNPGVVKEAYDLKYCVGLADVSEELVAEALTLGRALHQPGNVHELNGRRNSFGTLRERGQCHEPLVGHPNHPYRRVDGAEGVVLRRYTRLGERIKKCGL